MYIIKQQTKLWNAISQWDHLQLEYSGYIKKYLLESKLQAYDKLKICTDLDRYTWRAIFHFAGTEGFDDFSTTDAIFTTAVDEWTLDAARGRAVQDAATSDTRTELSKIMTDKLRAL